MVGFTEPERVISCLRSNAQSEVMWSREKRVLRVVSLAVLSVFLLHELHSLERVFAQDTTVNESTIPEQLLAPPSSSLYLEAISSVIEAKSNKAEVSKPREDADNATSVRVPEEENQPHRLIDKDAPDSSDTIQTKLAEANTNKNEEAGTTEAVGNPEEAVKKSDEKAQTRDAEKKTDNENRGVPAQDVKAKENAQVHENEINEHVKGATEKPQTTESTSAKLSAKGEKIRETQTQTREGDESKTQEKSATDKGKNESREERQDQQAGQRDEDVKVERDENRKNKEMESDVTAGRNAPSSREPAGTKNDSISDNCDNRERGDKIQEDHEDNYHDDQTRDDLPYGEESDDEDDSDEAESDEEESDDDDDYDEGAYDEGEDIAYDDDVDEDQATQDKLHATRTNGEGFMAKRVAEKKERETTEEEGNSEDQEREQKEVAGEAEGGNDEKNNAESAGVRGEEDNNKTNGENSSRKSSPSVHMPVIGDSSSISPYFSDLSVSDLLAELFVITNRTGSRMRWWPGILRHFLQRPAPGTVFPMESEMDGQFQEAVARPTPFFYTPFSAYMYPVPSSDFFYAYFPPDLEERVPLVAISPFDAFEGRRGTDDSEPLEEDEISEQETYLREQGEGEMEATEEPTVKEASSDRKDGQSTVTERNEEGSGEAAEDGADATTRWKSTTELGPMSQGLEVVEDGASPQSDLDVSPLQRRRRPGPPHYYYPIHPVPVYPVPTRPPPGSGWQPYPPSYPVPYPSNPSPYPVPLPSLPPTRYPPGDGNPRSPPDGDDDWGFGEEE